MTLVIAKICQGYVRVDSDSMITDPNVVSNRNNIFSGVLKTIIINPKMSVSFAGDVEYAQDAIEEIYSQNDFRIEIVKTILLNKNLLSGKTTDFLIVSIENQPLLYKIKDGKIDISNQNQWIGDIKGFAIFQKHFINNVKSTDPKHIMDIQEKAFDEVVDAGIDGIGGFRITTHLTKNGLEYQLQLKNYMNGQMSFTTRANESVLIPFGNAQVGSFATTFLPSIDPENPAVAIHFPYGKFGALFCFKISRKIILIKNVDGTQFIEEVENKYNIKLGGLTMH